MNAAEQLDEQVSSIISIADTNPDLLLDIYTRDTHCHTLDELLSLYDKGIQSQFSLKSVKKLDSVITRAKKFQFECAHLLVRMQVLDFNQAVKLGYLKDTDRDSATGISSMYIYLFISINLYLAVLFYWFLYPCTHT